eukprot:TRINITY_DN3091_c0_g2_i2.p2 TRINITY_DN3091_c0_g2~~TRINITY_DN3091_c0_g2_i2.p2  ORF type:complete len:191 (-),score=5.35 TRINITY_DN3091_c0_g2_i2:142-714(-)
MIFVLLGGVEVRVYICISEQVIKLQRKRQGKQGWELAGQSQGDQLFLVLVDLVFEQFVTTQLQNIEQTNNYNSWNSYHTIPYYTWYISKFSNESILIQQFETQKMFHRIGTQAQIQKNKQLNQFVKNLIDKPLNTKHISTQTKGPDKNLKQKKKTKQRMRNMFLQNFTPWGGRGSQSISIDQDLFSFYHL